MVDDSTQAGARTTAKFAVFVVLGFLVSTGLGLSAARTMIDRSVHHFQVEVLEAKVDAAAAAINLLAEREQTALRTIMSDLSREDLSASAGEWQAELAAVALFDKQGRLLLRGTEFPNIYLQQASDFARDIVAADGADRPAIRQSVISSKVLYGSGGRDQVGEIGAAVVIRASPVMSLEADETLKIVEVGPKAVIAADYTDGGAIASVSRSLGLGKAGLILQVPEKVLAQRREAIQIVVSVAMIGGLIIAFVLIFVMGRRLILKPFAELRLSRELLRRSETEARRLAVAVEAASDHIMISDRDGVLVWVNQATVDGTGYGRDELIGNKAGDLLFGDGTPDEVRKLVVSARETQEQATFRSYNYKKSGEPYVADVSLTPIVSDDGDDVSYVAIERNATESHIAEERLKNAVDAMNDGFAIVGADGRFRITNAAFRNQMAAYGVRLQNGDTYDGMIYQIASSGMVDTSDMGRENWAAEKLADFRAAKDREYYTTDPDGVTALRRQRTLPSGETVFLATDVTELHEARARAVEAMEAKSRFTASISHELRTPLNGMISMSELLLDGDLGQSERSGVELIRQSGMALLDIINDILDFSKLEAGRLEIRPEPFDILSGLEDVASLLTPAASAKGLTLLFRFDARAPRVLVGDLGRIRQIVTNLLGNAIKFTDTDWIELRLGITEHEGRAQVLIEVEDTGLGIAAADLANIFAPFEQARNQAALKAQEGTGLGLSICRELAMIMGGHLSAKSELGVGSCFQLALEMPIATSAEVQKISDTNMLTELADIAMAIHGPPRLSAAFADQARALGATVLDAPYDDDAGRSLVRVLVLTDQGEVVGDVPADDAPLIVVAPHNECEISAVADDYISDAAQVLRRPVRTVLLQQAIKTALGTRPNAATATSDEARADPIVTAHISDAGRSLDLPLIIAAEDNPTNSFILQAMLKDAPFRLKICPDAGSALSAIAAERPSLVLMDLHLPDMSGAEATAQLRQRDAAEQLPPVTVLGYTAGMTDREKADCLAAGMDSIIVKPISRDDLIHSLSAAIPQHRAAS